MKASFTVAEFEFDAVDSRQIYRQVFLAKGSAGMRVCQFAGILVRTIWVHPD
jgi:hypothetical protein